MSQHLPALRPVKVLKALPRAGFYVHPIKGSHDFLKHSDRPDLRVPLEDTQLVRASHVIALVDYVQQVSGQALDGLAG